MERQFSDWFDPLKTYVETTFFHPGTALFYDYAASGDSEHRFDRLPRPEEIAALDPEPCGRGTGMEDCPLHAGCMLDLLCRTGDLEFARRVLTGLYNLTMLHGTPGFVARGFSPFAGTLCYPNSSRDQFTLAVFGGWRAAGLLTEREDRGRAAELLGAVSDYCLRQVTRENGWNLMRRDGGRAMVSVMRYCDPHEALRLPMIHAAAGVVRNEPERIAAAAELLPETAARTLELDLARNWWDIQLVQLQLSVVLLDECGAFPAYRETFREIRRNVGILARRELAILLDRAEQRPIRLDAPAPDWRTCARRTVTVPAAEGGITYQHVRFPADYHAATELLRGIGNLLTTLSYAEETPTGGEWERIGRLFDALPLKTCCSGGLIQLLCGLGLAAGIAVQPHPKERNPYA